MRTATLTRNTAETQIALTLTLEGRGESSIDTGCGFLDHMLTLFAKHGRFDMTLKASGDTQVDYHHLTEDIGIALGLCLKQALGDKKGIVRYGNMLLPMDEALILSAVDISGRGMCVYELHIPAQKVGDFDTELGKEFFVALANNAGITLHLRQLAGENSHHLLEGAFKSVARSLKEAVAVDAAFAEDIPSTKGVLA